MSKSDTPEVSRDDQANINSFGRLNNRLHELDAELEGKKKLLDDLEDASNEIMITEDTEVRYVVGGTFVTVPNDDAETRLQSATEEAGSEVERLGSERESIVKEMTRLKGVLYAKFGDAINLED